MLLNMTLLTTWFIFMQRSLLEASIQAPYQWSTGWNNYWLQLERLFIWHVKPNDFTSHQTLSLIFSVHLELIDGTPTLKINHGSGTVVLQLPGNVNVADRRWHRLDVRSNSKVRRSTSLAWATVYKIIYKHINTELYLQIKETFFFLSIVKDSSLKSNNRFLHHFFFQIFIFL